MALPAPAAGKERFVHLGYKIGVGGTITYPRASKPAEVMARLPLSALLLETDAPDMPPNGFQGQPSTDRNKLHGYLRRCQNCVRRRQP